MFLLCWVQRIRLQKSSYTSAFYGKTEEQERRGRWTLSIYFETSNTRICIVCVTAVGIIA